MTKGGHNIYKITHKDNLKVYITNNLEKWLEDYNYTDLLNDFNIEKKEQLSSFQFWRQVQDWSWNLSNLLDVEKIFYEQKQSTLNF